MESPHYQFRTRWEVNAPKELLYDLLSDPAHYPVWMKSLHIKVSALCAGNEKGIGREDDYEIRAFLPYTLRWKLKCIQAQRPHAFLSEASGDLEGTGRWSFNDSGHGTAVIFDWRVRAHKNFLRTFSWLLRPVFQWNHDWVMRRWEKDLRAEVERVQKRSNLLVRD